MGTAPKGPNTSGPTAASGTPATAAPAVKVGIGDLVLDRYRVVEQVAQGGHSVVFRALDERLSRPVCIKVFSGLGGKSGVGRTSYEHFVQEAFALSRLTHPNTLRIYDFGHLGTNDVEGMPLQVCEFMNGGTLSQVVREQGRQSLAETSRVIGAMCAALAEAHALGIVHRDIKPQNILFGSVGNYKLPKLADFGIAKWSAEEPESKRAEDTAIVAGQKLAMYSPSWAAPEQLAGQPVSAQTDIYSLAVVSIYMLSGRAIFADEDVYAGYKKRRNADDLIRDTLAPLGVPRQVIALLTKALAFDPKNRLGSVDELANELSRALDLPTESSKPSANEPTEQLHPVTPTTPNQAITPPAGMPHRPSPPHLNKPVAPVPSTLQYPAAPPPSTYSGTPVSNPASPPSTPRPFSRTPTGDRPPNVGRVPTSDRQPRLESEPPVPTTPTPPVGWVPPTVTSPWMTSAAGPTGQAHPLALSDVPQAVGDRSVHFIHATTNVADLSGGQGKVRVTFIASPTGGRVIHLKGMSCFVAHLGGRPSPAVQIDQPGDIALVTPRAQEIGHIRVANGLPQGTHMVFPIGNELVALHSEDCTDPILFDFGPGSFAYFVYTRGRPIPKSRHRR